MPKLVLRNCYIEVDGHDLSSHTSSATINLSKDDVETTNFGGDGRERVAGLKDDSFKLTFQQDFDTTSVDSILYPLYDLESEFTVKVRPYAGPASATNPEYSATCILLEYSALDGKVGDLSEIDVEFPAQRVGITRATA